MTINRLLATTALATASLFAALPAAAQTTEAPAADQAATPGQADTAEDIIVTGSRVVRGDATAATPISVVSAAEIKDAGNLSLSDVLRKDPALGSLSRGPSVGLNGAGVNTVDLRNLGTRRTLVMIDGRRYPKFVDILGNGGQDISGIPSNMVKRIEVLRDGASTTYGADAVAGVVNFILLDDFEGLQLDAYDGISSRGDGFAYRLGAVTGMRNDRGGFVLGVQYQHQDNIEQDQRGWAHPMITGFTKTGAPIFDSANTPGGRVTAATALPGSPAGTLLACYANEGGAANLAPGGCPAYDSSVQSSLYSGSTIKSVGVNAHYDITDGIRFKVEGFYTDRNAKQDISATQINLGSVTGAFPSGFVIPGTNANNPYGRDVRFTWRPAQYGPRPTITDSKTSFITGGFSGTLAERFDWELTHTFGRTESFQRTPNSINSLALYNLLNPDACDADPVCDPIGAVSNIADLLNQTTPLSDAQQDYLFNDSTARIRFTSQQTLASISGPIARLPAGDLALAIGAEHRSEEGRIDPDSVVQSGALIGSQVLPSHGSFTTNEAFGELNVPIFKNQPFAQELTLNLQGRYSHFSNFGGATTYKIGLNYAPSHDIRFRAAYGTSFRAPDVLELYAGGVVATGGFQDPCNAGGLRATNSTVAANCAALGVPADFNQPAPNLPQRSGGNPALQPEKGKTYTLGAVITPSFLPGLTVTADYYHIRINDSIGSVNVQSNLNDCYSDPNFAARAGTVGDVCYTFNQRGPTGALGILLAGNINRGTQTTSGVDMSAHYRQQRLPFDGALDLNLRLSYLAKFSIKGVDYVGTYPAPGTFVDGFTNFPRWRGSGQIGYSAGRFSIQWTTNFVDRMNDFFVGTTVPVDNALSYSGTPRYFSHDLLLRVADVADSTFTLGVNNLTDKKPPYAFITTKNTLTSADDVIGRYFFMSVSHKF